MRPLSLANNLYFKRSHPVSLVHFITDRCNARCPHCFIDFDGEDHAKGELTLEEIQKISKNMGPHLMNINLTGGEPFLRKDIAEIARCYFTNTSIESIFITTHGGFPDRIAKFAEEIRQELGKKKIIMSFSIDDFEEQHNQNRKVKNLFDNVLESYRIIKNSGDNFMANIAITVSHTNHNIVMDLYHHLVEKQGIKAVTVTAVRDEGVYNIPLEEKEFILTAYSQLSEQVAKDMKSGKLGGYDTSTLLGRMMNKKNMIVNQIIKETYLEPKYISDCFAGSLFGVIGADGTVFPCEILERPLGSLREYDYDFLALWNSSKVLETRKWVKDTKCNCTYECAWSFNVMGNWKYQPKMISAALGNYW
jgi:MoaA/NifB/PqqE/SkfB family radical SAM enzyme